MRNEKRIEAIESQLSDALELGVDTEVALAETAGLICEAEDRFARLARPSLSLPPPPRSRA
jgi:hypothetical protein